MWHDAAMAQHLTECRRVVKANASGGSRMPSIAWTKSMVLEAAEEEAEPDSLRLRAKLERACGCTIAELVKATATWPVD
jgi:hypothetical protein